MNAITEISHLFAQLFLANELFLSSDLPVRGSVRHVTTLHICSNDDAFFKAKLRHGVSFNQLHQWFSTEGTCPLQGTFSILAGDITPSAVMRKINAFLRSNSVALQEIYLCPSLFVLSLSLI